MKYFLKQFSKNFLVYLLMSTHLSWALPEDRELPFEITSDTAEFDQKAGISIYKGNVLVKQGTFEMTLTEAQLFLKEGVIDHIDGFGPVNIKYLPEKEKPWVYAYSEKVNFNTKTEIISLLGKAKVEQGLNYTQSDKILYDLKKNLITASGNKEKGERVKIVIESIKQK